MRRLGWHRYEDAMRTQIQEAGRIRLTFIRLDDLWNAINDLGIDPEEVRFLEGYAVVSDEAEYALRRLLAPALYPHDFVPQPGTGMNFCGVPGCGRTIAQHEGWTNE
jgi:hypothetical protein